jgi:hypothetical protein
VVITEGGINGRPIERTSGSEKETEKREGSPLGGGERELLDAGSERERVPEAEAIDGQMVWRRVMAHPPKWKSTPPLSSNPIQDCTRQNERKRGLASNSLSVLMPRTRARRFLSIAVFPAQPPFPAASLPPPPSLASIAVAGIVRGGRRASKGGVEWEGGGHSVHARMEGRGWERKVGD